MKKRVRTLLIPSMLDFHFPLLQYAFHSKNYNIVILDNYEDLVKTGLEYTHNDMCYPCVLIIGQMINALNSGKYDIDNTILLIPQAGDACRASNYMHMIKKALRKANLSSVPVISLNVKGLEKDHSFKIQPIMIFRAVAAFIYSDTLMILKNQIKPYEIRKGETDKLVDTWTDRISAKISKNKGLSFFSIKKGISQITKDFHSIKTENKSLQKLGIVGELYIKYCHLGNSDLEKMLEKENCEYYINGFSWYILYYLDTHINDQNIIMKLGYKAAKKYLEALVKHITDTLHKNGFTCIDSYKKFKENCLGKTDLNCRVGDGWLISGEAINLILNGYKKVLCIQPFGCMANHVCGKGIYRHIQKQFDDAQLVSIDYDSSDCDINIKNRIRMLLDIYKKQDQL